MVAFKGQLVLMPRSRIPILIKAFVEGRVDRPKPHIVIQHLFCGNMSSSLLKECEPIVTLDSHESVNLIVLWRMNSRESNTGV